jgi:histidinol-phosphatase (PHP family)
MLAVEALESKPCIVEINTGGMARKKVSTPYPSLWLLKEFHARKIPICINSDAHDTEHLVLYRNEAILLAQEAGYKNMTIITTKGREETGFL